jgi:hypothetical protein
VVVVVVVGGGAVVAHFIDHKIGKQPFLVFLLLSWFAIINVV